MILELPPSTAVEQPFCTAQALLNLPNKRPLCKLDLVGSYSGNHTPTFGRRANLEVSLARSTLQVYFICWNFPPKDRGLGQQVRALCELLALATEMKVSLNNPLKCSEIPLRGVSSVTSTPLHFFFPPGRDNYRHLSSHPLGKLPIRGLVKVTSRCL